MDKSIALKIMDKLRTRMVIAFEDECAQLTAHYQEDFKTQQASTKILKQAYDRFKEEHDAARKAMERAQ